MYISRGCIHHTKDDYIPLGYVACHSIKKGLVLHISCERILLQKESQTFIFERMRYMKAIILEQYGHANELKVAEIDTPELRENDVLVEVKATSVNPVDWQIREGYLAE